MNKTEELEEMANASHRACLALREDIVQALSENVCEVNFIKVDGSHRIMLCTLVPSMMDAASQTAATTDDDKPPRPVNHDIVKCYDVEAMGWRSFRVDSVSDWSIQ